jgi:Leucine-rich repeat (LRR) protein
MRAHPSFRELPEDVKAVNLTGRCLSIVPIRFSKNSQLQSLTLSRNSIQNLPRNLKKLRTLIMASNNLKEITQMMAGQLHSYPMIQTLDFSKNLLREIPVSFLNMTTLTSLNLFGNQLVDFDGSELVSLTNIDLGSNRLKRFPALPPSITTISLDNNRLSSLAVSLELATRLSLSGNLIRQFDDSCVFPQLTVLDVSHNRISVIPPLVRVAPRLEVFHGGTNLIQHAPRFPKTITEINMSHNKLASLPRNMAALQRLVTADFSSNRIRMLTQLSRTLEVLILFDNKIWRIEHNGRLPRLTQVCLSGNVLGDLPRLRATAVTDYYLSSNLLRHVRVSSFSAKAERIDLDRNDLLSLPRGLFNLRALRYLSLQQNRLSVLPKTIASATLIFLNISENPIKKLPPLSPALEQLCAASCGLMSLPESLRLSPELIELDVSGNQLTAIPFFPSLVTLRASRNRLVKFPKLPRSITSVDVSHNAIRKMGHCLNYPNLRYLDLSWNPIQEIPHEPELPMLRALRLTACPFKVSFDLWSCQALSVIDIVDSAIHLDHYDAADILLTTKRKRYPFSHCFSPGPFVSYATGRGVRDVFDDIPFFQKVGDICCYGLFDARHGGSNALAIVRCLDKFLRQSLEFTEAFFADFQRVVQFARHSDATFDACDMAFAIRRADCFFLLSTGLMEVFTVTRDKSELRFISLAAMPTVHHFRSRLAAQLSPLRMMGQYLVYGDKARAAIAMDRLEPSDRFIIFASAAVMQALVEADVLTIAGVNTNAVDLAAALRDKAMAVMSPENASVLVIDLAEADRPEPFQRLDDLSDSGDEEEEDNEELPAVALRDADALIMDVKSNESDVESSESSDSASEPERGRSRRKRG